MWAAGHDEGVGAPSVERVVDLLLGTAGASMTPKIAAAPR
jgi:hypothetical protein